MASINIMHNPSLCSFGVRREKGAPRLEKAEEEGRPSGKRVEKGQKWVPGKWGVQAIVWRAGMMELLELKSPLQLQTLLPSLASHPICHCGPSFLQGGQIAFL